MWRCWLTHALINEFSRIEEIKGQCIRKRAYRGQNRCQMVTTALATCPPGEWIDVDILFTTMRRAP